MDESDLTVVLRPFDALIDQAFIYTTWRNGWYYGSKDLKAKDPKDAFRAITHEIKLTLEDSSVKIACLKDTPEVIIGYSVTKKSRLEWIYVKESFRNKGIGTFLLPKDIQSYGLARTKIGLAIQKKIEEKNHVKEDADRVGNDAINPSNP